MDARGGDGVVPVGSGIDDAVRGEKRSGPVGASDSHLFQVQNEKENLTHAERNELQKIAAEIQREFGE